MALFCASGGSHTYLDIPHSYQRRIKWPLERRLQPLVTFPLRTRFICQAEWAFCTQSFTWYKTIMLEGKRHPGTSQTIKWSGLFVCPVPVSLRACLHEGRRPQIGEGTCGGSPTYHVNVIKLKWEIIWTGGLPHLSGLPHIPGVPHLHVNRPLVSSMAVLYHVSDLLQMAYWFFLLHIREFKNLFNNGDSHKNVTLEVNSRCLKLYRTNSINSSNVGNFFEVEF